MATSSIFRNIEIKSEADCDALIDAMECAVKLNSSKQPRSSDVKIADAKDAEKIFGGKRK